jgi:hypothetical protein
MRWDTLVGIGTPSAVIIGAKGVINITHGIVTIVRRVALIIGVVTPWATRHGANHVPITMLPIAMYAMRDTTIGATMSALIVTMVKA